MQQVGEKMQTVGRNISTAGSTLTKTFTVPLVAAATAAVKTTADFDSSMSKLAAVSGATGNELITIRDKAREMGASTKFSAKEAADAFNYMAMAGWKSADMMSGIEGVLNLAAASGEDLATTSDIVTDSLTAFGESADQAGRLSDIMAAASSNANTNVSMMGETFKKVAPVAGALGYTMEDTALMAGLMANAGIKAEAAGTAMRRGFTNLVKPTKQVADAMERYDISATNSDGTMKDLRSVVDQLRTNFAGLTDAEKTSAAATIFGTQAYYAWLAVINGSEEDYEKLANAIDNSAGVAKSMAETMQDNLAGQLTILKSQLQELAISFGDILVPHIRTAVEWLQKQVDAFNSLDERTKEQIVKYGLMAAALGPVILVAGKLVTALGSIVKVSGKAVEAFGNMAKSFGNISPESTKLASTLGQVAVRMGPVAAGAGTLLAASFALGAGVNALAKEYMNSDEALAGYDKTLGDAANNTEITRRKFEEAGQAVQSAVDGYDQAMNELKAQSQVANSLADELTALNSKQSLTADESIRMQSVMRQLNSIYPELGLSIDEQTGKLNKSNSEIKTYIQSMQEMTKVQIQQEAYAKIHQEVLDATIARMDAELELQALEESVSDAVKDHANSDALLGTAQADVAKEIEATKATMEEYDKQIERGNKKIAELEKATGGLVAAEDSATDATKDLTAAQTELGDVTGATADEIIEAYNKEYESASGNLIGQADIFKEVAESEKASISDMKTNLNAHIEALRSWNENATFLMSTQEYQSDETFRNLVNHVVSAGDKLAPELAAMVEAYKNGDHTIAGLVDDFGHASKLDSQQATILAAASVAAQYGMDGLRQVYGDGFTDIASTLEAMGYEIGEAGEAAGEAGVSGLADSFNDGYGYISSAAEGGAEALEKPLESVQNEAQSIGAQTASNYASGITAISSYAGAAGQSLSNSAAAPLQELEGKTWTWGWHAGHNFGDGLSQSSYYVQMAARSLADAVAKELQHSTPEDGPLKDDDVWGVHLAQNLADGMMKGVGEVEEAGNALGGAIEDGFKDRLQIHSPSKTMAELGQEAMQGVIAGVNKEKENAQKSANEISKIYLQAAEKHLKLQQVMNKTSTEYEKNYWNELTKTAEAGTDGWYNAVINFYTASNKLAEENAQAKKNEADAVVKANQERIKATERNIKLQELTHTMTAQKEYDLWSKVLATLKKGTDEYYDVQVKMYEANNNLAAEQNKKRLAEEKKAADEQKKIAKQLAADQKAAYKSARDDVKALTSDYIKSVGELKKAYSEAYAARKQTILGSMGDLWSDTKTTAVEENPVRTLLNQVNQLRKYNSEVEKLRKRLGNSALFNELNTGNVADLERLKAINNMTDSQLKAYRQLYEERNKLADAQAKRDNADLKKSTEAQVETLTTAYQEAIKKANETIKKEGLTTGKAIVNGINLGIKNSMGSLKASFTKEAKDLVRSVRDALGIKSPSKVFADEVGAMIPPGITMGIQKAMPKTAEAMGMEMRKLVTIADRTLVDPDLISGRSAMNASLMNALGGLDANTIYDAVKAGTEAAETSIVISGREFARILRGLGVAVA